MKILVVAVILLLTACGGSTHKSVAPVTTTSATMCTYRAGGALPDPNCTPGVTNPDVTVATEGSTICKVGWTATIRPPSSVTGREKIISMKQYGVSDPHQYEYDHLISLELGGAPNDTRNLFPEPHHVLVGSKDYGSFTKDKIENSLKRQICSKKISLAKAQQIISTDWRLALDTTH